MLELKTKPISLFDVKTKTSVEDVYAEFDWDIIQRNQTLLVKKQVEIHKTFIHGMQHRVDQILNNQRLSLCQGDCPGGTILIDIHEKCFNSLAVKFKSKVRDSPLIFKFQIGMLILPI